MTLTESLLPAYTQMLAALSGWLEKAQANRSAEDANALLDIRLAADMYPLSSQIRFACLQAHEVVFRLKGEAVPQDSIQLAERSRDPNDKWSLDEAQNTIKTTLHLLSEVSASALDPEPGSENTNTVEIALPDDIVFDMTAEQYARDWALPQFYFHLNMAYAILRSEGVDLGKADYVAHAFGYLRS